MGATVAFLLAAALLLALFLAIAYRSALGSRTLLREARSRAEDANRAAAEARRRRAEAEREHLLASERDVVIGEDAEPGSGRFARGTGERAPSGTV